MKRWLVILSILCYLTAGGQTVSPTVVDSLNAETLKNLRRPLIAKKLADSTYRLARTIDYQKGHAHSAKFKGIGLQINGYPDSALVYYQEALNLFTVLQDTLEIGKVTYNIANYYNAKSDYEKSISYALAALHNFEQVNDLNGTGRVLNLIGLSYYYQKNYERALSYFQQHLRNSSLVNDSLEISSSWSNIGAVYQDLEKFDSARIYLAKAIRLKEKLNALSNIGGSYFNLGVLLSRENNFEEAQTNFLKAEAFYTQIADTARLAELYTQQGFMAQQRNNRIEAIGLLEKATVFSSRAGNKEILKKALGKLAEIQSQIGDYENAFLTLEKFNRVSDEILNEKNQESINLLRTQFETERKELLLAEQQLKLRHNQWLNLFLFTILSLLLIIFVFWRKQVEARKLKEIAQHEQKFQQQLTESVIAFQEKERARFAKDLHDGFGQLISSARMFLNQLSNQGTTPVFETLDQMHLEIRNIAFDLLPNTLVNEGLKQALRELVSRLNRSGSIAVQVSVTGLQSRLTEQLEISIYRVCQEWISNVLKYGSSKTISIGIVQHDDTLSLIIEDDGDGFDPILLNRSNGYGWLNIQSRIQLFQGKVYVESSPGIKGTSLIADIPLLNHSAALAAG